MDEANAALDFLDGLTERSGNFVLALCAIGVIVALARGWLLRPKICRIGDGTVEQGRGQK